MLFHSLQHFVQRKKRQIIIVVFVILFILLNVWCRVFRSFVLNITAPFLEGVTKTWHYFDTLKQEYYDLHRVKKENLNLKKELSQLQAKLVLCKELEKANQRLEKLLAFKKKLPYPVLGARVIGYTPPFCPAFIFIDRGAKDGVCLHCPIACNQGVIGQVVELSPHYAKVLLAVSSNSHIAVMSQRSRAQGIFTGKGINQGEVLYVSTGGGMEKGDLLITSGLDGIFPKGLAVGRVVLTASEPSSLFQKVMVKTTTDFTKLEEVLVILKPPSIPFKKGK